MEGEGVFGSWKSFNNKNWEWILVHPPRLPVRPPRLLVHHPGLLVHPP